MARRTRPPRRALCVDWAVAASALPGETTSGDLSMVEDFGDGVLVGVVDALGHGTHAAQAAEIAIATLRRFASESLPELVHRCHEALVGTRGVVLSLAAFDFRERTMSWLGVGNVEGVLLLAGENVRPSRVSLVNRGGIVGGELPTGRPWTVPISPGDTLLFATDGIRGGFADSPLSPGPLQSVADAILGQFAKGTDDALVLVARYVGPHA
jgi:phosphoserine phosphatase RsbX